MKRVIKNTRSINAASLSDITSVIEKGLKASGCTHIELDKRTSQYAQYKFTLPNDVPTSATFWYNYSIHNTPNPDAIKTLKWKSTYNVDKATGQVYELDSNGNKLIIGEAVVRANNPDGIKKIKDFKDDQIRSNSGDVVIHDLNSQSKFDEFIHALEDRVIDHI
jgi:hypothetical protein